MNSTPHSRLFALRILGIATSVTNGRARVEESGRRGLSRERGRGKRRPRQRSDRRSVVVDDAAAVSSPQQEGSDVAARARAAEATAARARRARGVPARPARREEQQALERRRARHSKMFSKATKKKNEKKTAALRRARLFPPPLPLNSFSFFLRRCCVSLLRSSRYCTLLRSSRHSLGRRTLLRESVRTREKGPKRNRFPQREASSQTVRSLFATSLSVAPLFFLD